MDFHLRKFTYAITSISDAKVAFEKWISKLEDNDHNRIIFEGKLRQLEGLSIAEDEHPDDVAHIEQGSFYYRIYLLNFERRMLTTRTYSVVFDSRYVIDGSPIETRSSVSTSVNITPEPFFLIVFCAAFSLLGAMLRYSMETTDSNIKDSIVNPLTKDGIKSVIISLLFFNLFEFTNFGKKLKFRFDWRRALIIGLLSGAFGDRVVEAIKALLRL